MKNGQACVFCEIRDGHATAEMVMETDQVIAFLDRRPVFQGHTLVIPREHHRNLFELPSDQNGMLFTLVQQIAVAVKEAMNADGVLIISNNGISQSVDHLHVHVIPRRKKDGLRGFMWPRLTYAPGEASLIGTRIRKALR